MIALKRITTLTVLDSPTRSNGNSLMSKFDLDLGAIQLLGCTLWRTEFDCVRMAVPHVKHASGTNAIKITDNALRLEITEAAYESYIRMGGQQRPRLVTKLLKAANA